MNSRLLKRHGKKLKPIDEMEVSPALQKELGLRQRKAEAVPESIASFREDLVRVWTNVRSLQCRADAQVSSCCGRSSHVFTPLLSSWRINTFIIECPVEYQWKVAFRKIDFKKRHLFAGDSGDAWLSDRGAWGTSPNQYNFVQRCSSVGWATLAVQN